MTSISSHLKMTTANVCVLYTPCMIVYQEHIVVYT